MPCNETQCLLYNLPKYFLVTYFACKVARGFHCLIRLRSKLWTLIVLLISYSESILNPTQIDCSQECFGSLVAAEATAALEWVRFPSRIKCLNDLLIFHSEFGCSLCRKFLYLRKRICCVCVLCVHVFILVSWTRWFCVRCPKYYY